MSLVLVFGTIYAQSQTPTHIAVRKGIAFMNDSTGKYDPPKDDSAHILVTIGYTTVTLYNPLITYKIGSLQEAQTYIDSDGDTASYQIFKAIDKERDIMCFVSLKSSTAFPKYKMLTTFYERLYIYYLIKPINENR